MPILEVAAPNDQLINLTKEVETLKQIVSQLVKNNEKVQNELAALHNTVRNVDKVAFIKSKSGGRGKGQKNRKALASKINKKATRRSTRNNPVNDDDEGDIEGSDEGNFNLSSSSEEDSRDKMNIRCYLSLKLSLSCIKCKRFK